MRGAMPSASSVLFLLGSVAMEMTKTTYSYPVSLFVDWTSTIKNGASPPLFMPPAMGLRRVPCWRNEEGGAYTLLQTLPELNVIDCCDTHSIITSYKRFTSLPYHTGFYNLSPRRRRYYHLG